MKATKKIVGATAALVAAVALSAGSTFAWFANNSTVSVTGMAVHIDQPNLANLVISADSSFSTLSSTVTASTQNKNTELLPATHYNSSIHKGPSSGTLENVDSNLVYLTNNEDVGVSSGTATNPEYAVVANTETSSYYVDYLFYIGTSTDTTLTINSLKATISNVKVNDTSINANDIYNAIAVDYYFIASTTTTAPHTLIANYDETDDLKVTTVHLNINTATELLAGTQLSAGVTVNKTTDTNKSVIVMRVYLDGEYMNGGSAFVNSTQTIDTNGVTFDIKFDVTPVVSD